jgi:uncharacterized protein (DUF1697 family)
MPSNKTLVTGGDVRVVLLRGVNVGGKRLVPMEALKQVAASIGCSAAATLIQSGNLVCKSVLAPQLLETKFATALAARFGFTIEVAVRTGVAWNTYLQNAPFADAQAERPSKLHIGVARVSVAQDAAKALAPYAKQGERIALLADALWIDFPLGVGTSKLTSSVIDRACGGTVTLRNFATAEKIRVLASRGAS